VLDGTEGAAAPFFSPDGRSIGFFADDKLKRIPVDGGTAIALSDAPYPYEGTWSEDGTIYFTSLSRLLSMPSSGGTARPVTEFRPGEQAHRSPQLLPGGKAFLLTVSHTYGYGSGATIDVQVIKTGARKTLVNEAYFGRYLPTSKTSGYLLYVQGSTIFARPMNGERLEITGPAVPVLQDVPVRPQYGFAQFAVTPSGNFVYLASADNDRLSLFWLDAAGNLQRLPASPARYLNLSASPDGKRIALLITSGATNNLSVYEWAKNQMTPLTFQTGASRQGSLSSFLAWSPDGKHIAVAMDAREYAGPGIYWVRADGAAVARRLVEGTELSPYSFSPDGKYLAYTDWSHGYEIRTVALDLANPEIPKMGTPKLFLSSGRAVFVPNFSPDGRWIAYSSWETPRAELSVRPFHASGPQAGARWQVFNEWNRRVFVLVTPQ
jgi:serine/threonine-protein kinase